MIKRNLSNNLEWKKLEDVAEIVMGQSPPSNTYNEKKSGVPFFQGKAEFGIRYTTVKKYCSVPTKLAKKGDILMSVRAPVGTINIANTDCCIGRGLCAIRPHKEIELLYLFHYLRLNEKEIEYLGQGSTFKAINRNEIKKIKIPVPSLPIQKQIISILEKVEKLKEKRELANKETSNIIQALFYDMFGDPFKNEKNYPIRQLDEVCIKITDGSHSTPKLIHDGYPFLTVANMNDRDFDYSDAKKISKEDYDKLVKNDCKPLRGDVLFSKDGTVGKVMEILEEKEQVTLSSIAILRPNQTKLLPTFFTEYMRTDFALRQAIDKKSGSGVRRIILKDIKTIKIPLPSIEEQKEFVRKTSRVYLIKEKQKQSTEDINHLFDALMQKAFNGELVA